MRRSNRRQRDHPWHRRNVPIPKRRIQVRTHQHQPIHRHAQLRLHVMRHPRPAIPAIALANQILLIQQTIILHQPLVDHQRQVLNVRRRRIKQLLGLRLIHQRLRKSRPDRVDEHLIGKVQPGPRIIRQRSRIAGRIARIRKRQMLRPNRPQIQINARSPRPAIHRKQYRPIRRPLLMIERISRVHHIPGRLALVIHQPNRPHGSRVVQRLAMHRNRLFDRLIGRQFQRLHIRRLLRRLRRIRCRLLSRWRSIMRPLRHRSKAKQNRKADHKKRRRNTS